MKFKILTILQKSLFLIGFMLCFQQASGQTNDAKIYGRIKLVSKSDNALVVKLQAKAIHNTDDNKILMLTNHSLWLRYDSSLVSYNISPIPSTDSTMTDGDFFYPGFEHAYYGNYGLDKFSEYQHKGPGDIAPGDYAITHVIWEGWRFDPGYSDPATRDIDPDVEAVVINEWRDVAYLRLPIKATGLVQLRWGLGYFEDEILDENLVAYEIDPGSFEGLDEQVFFIEPVLQLTSRGLGIDYDSTVTGDEDPFIVNIKSTNDSLWKAGTLGFHIYYSSDEADYVSSTQLISNPTSFNWGPGTVIDQSISDLTNGAVSLVQKGPMVYDRRITYINNDGVQSNDIWPKNSETAIDVLSVIFKYKGASMWTHLETVDNEETFKNWPETLTYTSIVTNPSRESAYGSNLNVLPVKLTYFTGKLNDNHVALNWQTAQEENNDHFVVERSTNGKRFEPIATVKGKGTSAVTNNYSLIDSAPVNGISYYRLKQVDLDGKFQYSSIVSISNNGKGRNFGITMAYPNPFREQISVNLNSAKITPVTLSIFNSVGKLVATRSFNANQGLNEIKIGGLGDLAAGMYTIRVTSESETSNFKILKQ